MDIVCSFSVHITSAIHHRDVISAEISALFELLNALFIAEEVKYAVIVIDADIAVYGLIHDVGHYIHNASHARKESEREGEREDSDDVSLGVTAGIARGELAYPAEDKTHESAPADFLDVIASRGDSLHGRLLDNAQTRAVSGEEHPREAGHSRDEEHERADVEAHDLLRLI